MESRSRSSDWINIVSVYKINHINLIWENNMNSNRKIVARLFAAVLFSLVLVAFLLLSYERTQAEKILYTGKENHVISLEKARQTW